MALSECQILPEKEEATMPMTDRDRELYLKERKRIAEELGVPEDEVILLDVDQESADWIPRSNLTTPASRKARAKFRASQNREEGGE